MVIPKHTYQRPGPKLSYRLDLVTRERPLTIQVKQRTTAKIQKEFAKIRNNVCQWGLRHGVRLVTRVVSSSPPTGVIEIHFDRKLI